MSAEIQRTMRAVRGAGLPILARRPCTAIKAFLIDSTVPRYDVFLYPEIAIRIALC